MVVVGDPRLNGIFMGVISVDIRIIVPADPAQLSITIYAFRIAPSRSRTAPTVTSLLERTRFWADVEQYVPRLVYAVQPLMLH